MSNSLLAIKIITCYGELWSLLLPMVFTVFVFSSNAAKGCFTGKLFLIVSMVIETLKLHET